MNFIKKIHSHVPLYSLALHTLASGLIQYVISDTDTLNKASRQGFIIGAQVLFFVSFFLAILKQKYETKPQTPPQEPIQEPLPELVQELNKITLPSPDFEPLAHSPYEVSYNMPYNMQYNVPQFRQYTAQPSASDYKRSNISCISTTPT